MATSTATPLLGAQCLEPGVRPPSAAVLGRLSEADRERLCRILSERAEFIAHPSFANAVTARALFGDRVGGERTTRPWCNAAVIDWSDFGTQGRRATLTTEQEQGLFQRLNYARYRLCRLLGKHAGKMLTARATAEILFWHEQAETAKCEIVAANLPLVLAMAKRSRLNHVDYAELISEGNMALLRSSDKFDCGRGFKFSTYACRAILKSFSRVAMRANRYRSHFPMEFDPSLERSDFIEKKRVRHESDCADELRGIMNQNRADLNEVEATVIKARFALEELPGFDSNGPRTLEQVGVLIGVTKERVRQIQNRALAKLKLALQEDFLAA